MAGKVISKTPTRELCWLKLGTGIGVGGVVVRVGVSGGVSGGVVGLVLAQGSGKGRRGDEL